MTVSIFSYQGEVTAGFMADTGLVPDPQPSRGIRRGAEATLPRNSYDSTRPLTTDG